MKIDKKRRIENKTDYRKRLILLKSKCPRLVVRKTNRYLIVQVIESAGAQDKVISSVNTKDLLKYGWNEDKKGSLKSIAAGYLAGILIGKRSKGIKKLILDSGLIPNTRGSKVYAVMKGVADSGIEINFDESIAPKKERLEGKKIGIEFNKIKENLK